MVVDPEILDSEDEEKVRITERDRAEARDDALAQGILAAAEAANESACLWTLLGDLGEQGVEAALAPRDEEDEDYDGMNPQRAGLIALHDWFRGGRGISPMQADAPPERRRSTRPSGERTRVTPRGKRGS